MHAAAFGLALGGLVLIMLAAGTKSADGPRPSHVPGAGYSKAAAETRYQRRRVAIVGSVCLAISLALVVIAAVTGGGDS